MILPPMSILIFGGVFMKFATILSFILVIVGALVWLLVGIFNFNLVASIFGAGSGAIISRIIYSLVGISAIWLTIYAICFYPSRRAN